MSAKVRIKAFYILILFSEANRALHLFNDFLYIFEFWFHLLWGKLGSANYVYSVHQLSLLMIKLSTKAAFIHLFI